MYHILYMYVSIFQCTRHINVPVNCGEIWRKSQFMPVILMQHIITHFIADLDTCT